MERHTDPFRGYIDQIMGEFNKLGYYLEEATSPEFKELIYNAIKNNFSEESKFKLINHPDYEKYLDYLKYTGKDKKLDYLLNINKKFIDASMIALRNDLARKENWPDVMEDVPTFKKLVTDLIALEIYEESKDDK